MAKTIDMIRERIEREKRKHQNQWVDKGDHMYLPTFDTRQLEVEDDILYKEKDGPGGFLQNGQVLSLGLTAVHIKWLDGGTSQWYIHNEVFIYEVWRYGAGTIFPKEGE